jgi:hypothetical protein
MMNDKLSQEHKSGKSIHVAPKSGSLRKWTSYLEQGLIAGVAVGSVSIAVLDFLGFLHQTFLEDRIGAMTLLIIGIVAGYLVLERRASLERLNESVRELNNSFHQFASKVEPLEKAASRMTLLFEGFEGERFSELRLLYGLRSYNSQVTKNEIRAGRDQVFDLWTESLREATTFLAFNYVSADEVWGTKGWAFKVAHAAQIARLHLGATIKRVFIIDSPDEYAKIKDLMHLQKEAGVEVKWILKTEISNKPILDQYIRELGTWDFVAIDQDLLFRVEIDGQRQMTGCTLVRNRDLHQKALHVFREALQSGHDLKKKN